MKYEVAVEVTIRRFITVEGDYTPDSAACVAQNAVGREFPFSTGAKIVARQVTYHHPVHGESFFYPERH